MLAHYSSVHNLLICYTSVQMVVLYIDPEGENVFSRSYASSPHGTTEKGQLQLESTRTIENLQSKVYELQSALSKYDPDSKLLERKSSKVTFNEIAQIHHQSSVSRNGSTAKTSFENGKGVDSTAL